MGGAALVVDVHPVGVGVDHISAELGEAVEQTGGSGVGGAVGAVHQDTQSGQVTGDGALQMVDVVQGGLLRHIAHLADLRSRLAGHVVVGKEDDVLDLLLQLVGQLEALAVENFDPVVLKGVVAGRDDDAGVRLLVHRHPGHPRGGQSAQVQHIGSGGAQSRDQRALQQVSGDPGVLADGDQGLLPRLLAAGQHLSRSQSHLICQICVQASVDHAADAVRSKQFSHNCNTSFFSVLFLARKRTKKNFDTKLCFAFVDQKPLMKGHATELPSQQAAGPDRKRSILK